MKMSGHSLSIFISISTFCIFMLWFLTPINCALFLAFTLTPVAHYDKAALVVLVILSSALMLFGIKGFLLIPLCFVAGAQLQQQSSN